jgi:hypothetical protein
MSLTQPRVNHSISTSWARGDTELMPQLGVACAALELKAEARVWHVLAFSSYWLDSASQQALHLLTDPNERTPQPRATTRAG